MPTYVVTGPDGRKYRVTAPDGATKEQVLAYVQANARTPDLPPPSPAVGTNKAPAKSDGQNFMAGLNRGIANTLGFIPDAVGSALNAVLPEGLRGSRASTAKPFRKG